MLDKVLPALTISGQHHARGELHAPGTIQHESAAPMPALAETFETWRKPGR